MSAISKNTPFSSPLESAARALRSHFTPTEQAKIRAHLDLPIPEELLDKACMEVLGTAKSEKMQRNRNMLMDKELRKLFKNDLSLKSNAQPIFKNIGLICFIASLVFCIVAAVSSLIGSGSMTQVALFGGLGFSFAIVGMLLLRPLHNIQALP